MTGLALLLVLAAYVAGSVPSAYIAGRAVRGVDLRTVGSGNLGATNVYRELGVWPALAVLAVDAAKGALPVAWFPRLLDAQGAAAGASWWPLAFGAAAIVGHSRPVFLLWNGGGKGVATAAGVFAAVTPLATLAAFGAFVVVVAITRYVSLGSIVAATVLPIAQWATGASTPSRVAGVVVATFVVVSHRANVRRLLAHTERRLGRPGSAAS